MTEKKIELNSHSLDWKWVGVAYCLFVLFHLLPSFVLFRSSLDGSASDDFRFLSLLVGFGAISTYIGYRSRGVTLWELPLAALLYDATLYIEFRGFWGYPIGRSLVVILVWIVGTIALTAGGALLGELLQARSRRKRGTDEAPPIPAEERGS
jgi:hypothetical protein